MKIEIVCVTGYSASFEIVETEELLKPYYSLNNYDVYLNNEKILEGEDKKVFSLFDLTPDTSYELKIVTKVDEGNINFRTSNINKEIVISYEGSIDYTSAIQNAIDNSPINSAIIINEGEYLTKPLFLKDGITLYLKKGATLLASNKREDYPILDEYKDNLPYGTWEGRADKMYASLISILRVKDVKIIGEGCLDGNAENSDWWINHKIIRGATRPRIIYTNYASNILIQGLNIINSPCWTIHTYYSDNIDIIDTKVKNPKTSPNTDGADIESSKDVRILGSRFDVGDDCLVLKSGKMETALKYYAPTKNVLIRNCLMMNGHGGVVLGSEMGSGVSDLDVSNCYFLGTDKGLRIKTRRGRGEKSIVDGVEFRKIYMRNVPTPIVINMFYNCDSDGNSSYVQSKEKEIVDERTPYLGEFRFKDIVVESATNAAVFIYGLPERKIKKVSFENVNISIRRGAPTREPAMMMGAPMVSSMGCFIKNVEEVEIKNLNVSNQIGEKLILKDVDKIIYKD